MPLDFASLELTPKPNQYLVCPPGICAKAQTVHREPPSYPATVAQVIDAFLSVVAKQARVTPGPADLAGYQFDFVQRSAIMRYPDTITVKFLPVDSDHTTLAIYSRSHYGYSDMGVNKARIDSWLDQLELELASKRKDS
jgi:uncharacterized protein (DUF1499 family)